MIYIKYLVYGSFFFISGLKEVFIFLNFLSICLYFVYLFFCIDILNFVVNFLELWIFLIWEGLVFNNFFEN